MQKYILAIDHGTTSTRAVYLIRQPMWLRLPKKKRQYPTHIQVG